VGNADFTKIYASTGKILSDVPSDNFYPNPNVTPSNTYYIRVYYWNQDGMKSAPSSPLQVNLVSQGV
jgi:hypothetical protein